MQGEQPYQNRIIGDDCAPNRVVVNVPTTHACSRAVWGSMFHLLAVDYPLLLRCPSYRGRTQGKVLHLRSRSEVLVKSSAIIVEIKIERLNSMRNKLF